MMINQMMAMIMTINDKLIRSDEGLTLETSAFNLFTVANLPYQR